MFERLFSKILYREVSSYVNNRAKQRRMRERQEAQYRLDEEKRQKAEQISNARKIEFADKIRLAESYLFEVVNLEQLVLTKMDKINEHFNRVWLSKNSIEREHYRFPKNYEYIFLTTPQYTELLNKLEILQQFQSVSHLSESQKKTILFILQSTLVIEHINAKLVTFNYKINGVRIEGPTLYFPISMLSF
jgi:hypothetical protein